ncbi:MAG: cold-shock protein [Planctomycetales bacterium]
MIVPTAKGFRPAGGSGSPGGVILGDRLDPVCVSAVEEGVFDTLKEGQAVEYDVIDDAGNGGDKGPRAGNVRPC